MQRRVWPVHNTTTRPSSAQKCRERRSSAPGGSRAKKKKKGKNNPKKKINFMSGMCIVRILSIPMLVPLPPPLPQWPPSTFFPPQRNLWITRPPYRAMATSPPRLPQISTAHFYEFIKASPSRCAQGFECITREALRLLLSCSVEARP